MKFLKTISSVAVIMLAMAANTYAAGDFSFYEIITNENKSEIIVEGTANPLEEVNVLILKPGKAVTDQGGIVFADNITTDTKGNFTANVKMIVDSDPNGEYKCTVGGKGFDGISQTKSLYFASVNERKAAILAIKSASDVKAKLEETDFDVAKKLSIYNSLAVNVGFDKIGTDIGADKSFLDDVNYMQTLRKIQQKVLIAAYQTNKTNLVQKNNEFLYSGIIDFSSIDKDGVTLYDAYKNVLSDTGRSNVITALCGNSLLKTEDDMLKEFAKQVILVGIKNAGTAGDGHIEKLITSPNALKAGLDTKGYVNLTSSQAKATANS